MLIKDSTEYSLKRFEPFFSDEYGIINYFHIIQSEPHFPELFYGACRLCNISLFNGFPIEFSVGGCGETKYESIFSSLGEAIERYSASIVPVKKLIYCSYNDLISKGEIAVGPDDYPLFSDEQYNEERFNCVPFTHDSMVGWIEGNVLRTGEKIFVPAALVFLPYILKKGEAQFNHLTTTGLSFGFSKEHAVLNGLNEVIERDCFTITWLSKLQIQEVDYKNCGIKSVNRLLKKAFKNFKGKLTVFDIKNDIDVPAFLGLIEMEDANDALPAMCVGASANPDKEKALYKTIMETAQTYTFASFLKQKETNGYPFTNDYEKELYNFDLNVLFYSYKINKKGISFIKENKELKSYVDIIDFGKADLNESINYNVSKLYNLGYEPVTVDLTPDDIKSCGGYVVKTIVPGLVPLHGAYKYPHLGNPRIYNVPKNLGYYDHVLDKNELNKTPHPFP